MPKFKCGSGTATLKCATIAVKLHCVTCALLQVDTASNRIAHYLHSVVGVVPGSAVGLLLHCSPLLVVALLGVLKAGAAYLSLDPNSNAHSIGRVMRDIGVKVNAVRRSTMQGVVAAGCSLLN